VGGAAWFELADGLVAPLYKMSQPQGRPDILRSGITISENYLSPMTGRLNGGSVWCE
jgi:hypothetical protein